MAAYRFNPAKLEKLNDPGRLDDLVPDVIWTAFGAPTSGVMVDIGAGTGLFAREFASRMETGTIWAVDDEPLMVQWMQDNLPGEVLSIVHPLAGDATAVPLPDGSADLVYAIVLYHELPDPRLMLREALRLLSPGGTMGIVDWKAEETPHGPPLAHRIDAPTIAAHLAETGFTDVVTHAVLPYHNVVTARRPE